MPTALSLQLNSVLLPPLILVPVAVIIILWAQRRKRRDTNAVNAAPATRAEDGPPFEAGAMASGNPAYK